MDDPYFENLVMTLTLLYTKGGHYGPPLQLESLTAPTGRFSLVQFLYKFGHMGTNYDKDPKNVSKCQQCLSYASCDEMIKITLCKVGLKRHNRHVSAYVRCILD